MAKYRTKPFDCTQKPSSYPRSGGKSHGRVDEKGVTRPVRRSARLRRIRDLNKGPEKSRLLPSPASDVSSRELAEHLTAAPQANARKRKRLQEPEDALRSVPGEKRPRVHLTHRTSGVEAADSVGSRTNSIDYWRKEGRWPMHYFVPESNMDYQYARKKSWSSLRRKRSDAGSTTPSSPTPSDQKPREEKSAPYRDPRYEPLLETKGSFMREDKEGPKQESKDFCRYLLENDQDTPEISRFSDNVFNATCLRIQGRNEAKIFYDITPLIVPSAETLADFGADHLECLVESINEGWNNSIPVTGVRPQPDYSVGFNRTAFSDDQLNRLQPFIGDFFDGDMSLFMATYYMYFPFLTCEVKCGAQALDIADRQNAHSMTLAVRGVVELFKRVKREKEIDREILAFSVSHDHEMVKIYGHYPVIKEMETKYYRYRIRKFIFTEPDGKEKWTAYKFTKNLYHIFMPTHFRRLCSAIDQLQHRADVSVPPPSEGTELSRVFENHHLSQSNANSVSLLQEDDSQATGPGPQDSTPNTSFSQPGSFKKPRKRRARES